MKKKIVRCAALLLGVLFLLGGAFDDAVERLARGSEPPVEAETKMYAWQKDAGEKVTFDWYVNFSWFATQWGGNAVSDAITDETGVSIHFMTPMGNEQEKLKSLIASDSLPDILTLGWWEPELNELIQNDMVYALNGLADKYDPYFWEVSDTGAVNWYTQADGNLYCYPNSSISPEDLKKQNRTNERFLVRKDIYEAIGSPDMTTPEGFLHAVKEAVRKYPKVNGEPLIPVGAQVFDDSGCVSFDKYLMDFLAIPREKNGVFYDRYTDSEYVRWLKTFRALGSEGCLANDIFVDSRTQTEEKLAQGQYFCMIYQYSDMESQQKALYQKDPDSIYLAVDGPKNAAGDAPTLSTGNVNGWTVTLISKNCKNPKRAIQFLNYLLSEHGQMRIYLGVEGVTYEMEHGVPVLKEEVRKLLDTDRAAYDRIYGADDAYWMLQDNVMQRQWQQDVSEAVAQLYGWGDEYCIYNGQYDVYFLLEKKWQLVDDEIQRLWGETLPELLLADSDEQFDRLFLEFQKQRDRLGYRGLMKEKTACMKEAKRRLGIQ